MIVAILALYIVPHAVAIDRNAKMIDTFAFDFSELDDMDYAGGSIFGETSFLDSDWAILFGGGYGSSSPNDAPNIDILTVSVGLKYYIIPPTSVSLLGTYQNFDQRSRSEKDAVMGTVGVKHRFISADEPVSPFVTGTISWRDRSSFSDPENEDTFSETLFSVGGGVEFAMRRDFAFVFEGAYVEADDSSDGSEDLDGFVGSIALRYYFLRDPSWSRPMRFRDRDS